MCSDPSEQILAGGSPRCNIKDDLLSVIYGRPELQAVQQQESLHRGVANALVAIDEWVGRDQREANRGSLFFKRRLELPAPEGHAWLGHCRLQRTQIANGVRTARVLHQELVQLEHLSERQEAH
jgi:hypothetical protein